MMKRVNTLLLMAIVGAVNLCATTNPREVHAHEGYVTDEMRLECCWQAVYESQLQSGAIVAINYLPIGAPLRYDIYFALLNASAMMQYHAYHPRDETLDYVERFLTYACNDLNTHGRFRNFNGKKGPNNTMVDMQEYRVDADDAAAGLLLYNLARFSMVRELTPAMVAAAHKCVDILRACDRDGMGLYYNFAQPQPNVVLGRFCVDNIEVGYGWASAWRIFAATGEFELAAECNERASWVATWLRHYYMNGHFAVLYGDTQSPYTNHWECQYGHVKGLASYTALFSFRDIPQSVSQNLLNELTQRYTGSGKYPDFEQNWNLHYAYELADPDLFRAALAVEYGGTSAMKAEYLSRMRVRTDHFIDRMLQVQAGHTYEAPYSHKYAGAMVYFMKRLGGNEQTQFPRALLGWQ